jgi:hypothetical protein
MEEDERLKPYEVFAGTAWEAGLLKSILDDNEIESFIKNHSNIPWVAFPVASSSVKVYVAQMDFETAMDIVHEFENNMKGNEEMKPGDE